MAGFVPASIKFNEFIKIKRSFSNCCEWENLLLCIQIVKLLHLFVLLRSLCYYAMFKVFCFFLSRSVINHRQNVGLVSSGTCWSGNSFDETNVSWGRDEDFMKMCNSSLIEIENWLLNSFCCMNVLVWSIFCSCVSVLSVKLGKMIWILFECVGVSYFTLFVCVLVLISRFWVLV